MQPLRQIVVPAYLIALALITAPLLDATLAAWPPQLGDINWRYGTVGIMTGALMTPLLGLFIALVVALANQHRAVLRTMMVLGAFAAITLAVVIVAFLLDAAQMYSGIRQELHRAFLIASVMTVFKQLFAAAIAAAFSVASYRALRTQRRAGAADAAKLVRVGGGAQEKAASAQAS